MAAPPIYDIVCWKLGRNNTALSVKQGKRKSNDIGLELSFQSDPHRGSLSEN